MKVQIDYEKCCLKNGSCAEGACDCAGSCCVEICPVQAIVREDKLVIDQNKCIACGSCVAVCKHQALTMM